MEITLASLHVVTLGKTFNRIAFEWFDFFLCVSQQVIGCLPIV